MNIILSIKKKKMRHAYLLHTLAIDELSCWMGERVHICSTLWVLMDLLNVYFLHSHHPRAETYLTIDHGNIDIKKKERKNATITSPEILTCPCSVIVKRWYRSCRRYLDLRMFCIVSMMYLSYSHNRDSMAEWNAWSRRMRIRIIIWHLQYDEQLALSHSRRSK